MEQQCWYQAPILVDIHPKIEGCRTFAEGGDQGSNTRGASTCHKEEVEEATEKNSSPQRTV